MPLLRCTDDECGHSWFERSHLAVDSPCEQCGEPTRVVGVDDEPPAELAFSGPPPLDRAHPGYARQRARQVAREYGFVRPPVVVHTIARNVGFTVEKSTSLGTLSGRLVGNVIEVNADEPSVRHRFTVAHELGHHFLHTEHGCGDVGEAEADAFAGELLVPGPMLRAAVEQTRNAASLRQRFRVSRDVLRIAAKVHSIEIDAS